MASPSGQICMLRFLRERVGLSREELSVQMDHRFSLSTWSRWETVPKEPIMTRRDWEDFCKIVKVPVEHLPLDLAEMGTKETLAERLRSRVSERAAGDVPALPKQEDQNSTQQSPESLPLSELRRQKGLSQERFASELAARLRAAGSSRLVTTKTISDWENGRHLPKLSPAETLEIVRYLGCSLEQLAMSVSKK